MKLQHHVSGSRHNNIHGRGRSFRQIQEGNPEGGRDGSRPEYITASVMEFLITSLLLSLYLFKLNKRLTFFFWPLVDMVNSVLAAVFFTVLSLVALITYHVTGTLVGGIVTFMSAALLCVDSYTLFRSITFNKRRGESQSQGSGAVNGGAADHP
ncbi:Chemokine-like factor [Scophthalmus maximus]|uniref:Chemokine-like factor n=1 Tax=Scophthalmus maximus TaxID=52904 RepID=A0A2U9BBW1_SCOMX|nr:chemokine-like factor isoform X2 [Scophthalmus maximus]AWP01448.1 Chemokine-like factor [Scophthalmus maximus]